jgi:hypothetical protein
MTKNLVICIICGSTRNDKNPKTVFRIDWNEFCFQFARENVEAVYAKTSGEESLKGPVIKITNYPLKKPSLTRHMSRPW